ncbi:phosphatidylinositol-specific phospholipase C domain-containing protein [Archangium violaceum]|uniref:phosphatidylinositol-specific phospholipase C domain-containing protein n=1 Tax=Archangium violaceum TaxID=83451 RepID=UPI002B290A94|nr:phosphatidylinositol-specific phospholipase C domain-containing protein [Archangium gephyra]
MANADWMSKLRGNPCITRLAIPGTHDSGAYQKTVKPMTRAQTLSIPEQLEAGVRALDIRCAATYGSEGTWTGLALDMLGGAERQLVQEEIGEERTTYNVFHGPFDQGVSIADVVAQVATFLQAHRGETVFLLLKQEGGSVDISEDINDIVNQGLGDKLFKVSQYGKQSGGLRWPKIDDCRGKAIVFSRLQNPSKEHYDTRGWPNNPKKAVLDKQLGGGRVQADARSLIIQDLYNSPPLEDKKKVVSDLLREARSSRTDDDLYFNFTSLVWKPWEPVWSGNTHMTPYLLEKDGGAGLICVDAVTGELASHIIGWNSQYFDVVNADWMSKLKGNPCITRLAIPGTHDSGAYQKTVKPMTRAQTLSIPEQLEVGVRALDIRCAATYGSEGTWTGLMLDMLGGTERQLVQEEIGEERTTYNVFHGPFDQGVSIADVVAQVATFLQAHRGETVFLLLKQEGGSVDISEDINDIVNQGLGDKLFKVSQYGKQSGGLRWPKIDDCRGKAIVFSRLQNPSKEHYDTRGWPNNPKKAVLDKQLGGGRVQADARRLLIQDLYSSPPLEDKKKVVSDLLQEARSSRTDNDLYFNFTSLVWKPWEPVWSGNTHMTPYLLVKQGGVGLICVDAVTRELASHIIDWNSQYLG